jgi:hypothetical protein
MCKPGSACCGCGTSSSGVGVALAVVAGFGFVSMAAALISDILTAVLVGVFSLAAAGTIMLVIILRRTRGVVTRPRSAPGRPAGARRPIAARAWAVPLREARTAPGRAALAGPPAAPALTVPQPLAIEAPVPAPLRLSGHAWVPDAIRPGIPPPAIVPARAETGPAGPDVDVTWAPPKLRV